MATSQILLCFAFHFLLLISLPLETATSETTEGRALLKWKNTLDFNTDVLHSWSIANLHNICWNWTGITCNDVGAVYKIKLDNFSLSGTLESLHFNSFPNLTHFILNNNSFAGSIPYAIANLSQLIFLDLSFNHFVSFIPSEIGKLTKLRFLNLGGNRLGGTIPSQISYLQHLTSLSLFANSLTGQIPEEMFSNLSNLQTFNCRENMFHGPFPPSLVKLSKLKQLYLSGNNFYGSIPPTIGNLSSLTILDLSDNMLQGNIPEALCNLHSLNTLYLSDNTFSGLNPPCLGNITSLRDLSLDSIVLHENIPRILCNLHSLEGLELNYNCLGDVGRFGPTVLWKYILTKKSLSQIQHAERKYFRFTMQPSLP
nr:receptor-like protein 12 [Ipomoea batatas]